MKLIVQIPCFNEEQTLPQTVADIPRRIDGIDEVEVLVIDDGSTDETARVARKTGVDHVVRHGRNRGLGVAFRSGLDACLRLGADIIVNTDGDNQYRGQDIERLVGPLVRGEADLVVGDRQTASIAHFTATKKRLQWLGSFVARRVSGVSVPDAVSGFRALSRDAALQMNILSPYSYTIEMLIQAGRKQLTVTSVPVRINPQTRASRLFRSVPSFVSRSLLIMIRTYAMYRPLRVFLFLGALLFVGGAIPIARFLYFFARGDGTGHVQSLVLGGSLAVIGFLTFLIGLLADLISFNRQLLETALEKVRRLELHLGVDGSAAGSLEQDEGDRRDG